MAVAVAVEPPSAKSPPRAARAAAAAAQQSHSSPQQASTDHQISHAAAAAAAAAGGGVESPTIINTGATAKQTSTTNTGDGGKPDEAFYRNIIAKEQTASQAIRTQLIEINKKIQGLNSGRNEYFQQKEIIRQTLDSLQAKIDALEKERSGVQTKLNDKQRAAANTRQPLSMMNTTTAQQPRTPGVKTQAEIEQRLKELRREIMVSTMSVKEEKKVLADIEKLQRESRLQAQQMQESRAAAAAAAAVAEPVSDDTPPAMELQARSIMIREELRKLRDQKRDEQEKRRCLVAERERALEPLRDLVDQQEELRSQMLIHDDKRREYESELGTKMLEYREKQASIRNAQINHEKIERQRSQFAERRQDLQSQLDAIDVPPADIALIRMKQVLIYLQDTWDKANPASKAQKDAVGPMDEQRLEEAREAEEKFKTMVRVVPKSERVEAGPISKKDKRRLKYQQHQSNNTPTEEHTQEKSAADGDDEQKPPPAENNMVLNHTIATIQDFNAVGLKDNFPRTLQQVPGAIEFLSKKVEGRQSQLLEARRATAQNRDKIVSDIRALEVQEKEFTELNPPPKVKGAKKPKSNDENADPITGAD